MGWFSHLTPYATVPLSGVRGEGGGLGDLATNYVEQLNNPSQTSAVNNL
jgi:hypothetical protein